MFEPSDLTKDPPSYEKGDIVWVKLSAYWWPGEVKLEEDLPSDLAKNFKKPPLLIVKFFEEDTYEYIKQWSHVFPYNCDRKAEFIKKGMAGFRAKLSHMTTFPRDIVTAEEKTNGDPNILSQAEFLPNRKINLDEIFGTPSPKKAAKNKTVSAKKSYSRDNSPLVTHRRFLGNDDYKSYIYIQHVGKDRQPDSEDEEIRKLNEEPEKVLSCESCGFHTKRLGVLLIHNKLHLEGAVYVTPKRKSKKIKEEELVGSDTEVAVESPPKPKQRKKNMPQVKPQTQPVDHFAKLLDEWNDTDDETESSAKQVKDHNKRGKKLSAHVLESKNDTSDNSSEKSMPEEQNKVNTQEDIKNCFDFDEEEEEDDFLYPASTGRKIPRVIPEKPRASISELLELSDKEEQLSKGDSYKQLDIEDANVATEDDNRNKEILRVSQSLNKPAVDDTLDNAFKELLEETEVPHLDELAQSLKPEQNFHDARTIKFPDKGSTTLKTPVKGGTSKKRFVTSFEGFKAGFRKVDIGRNEDKKLTKGNSSDHQIQEAATAQSDSTEVCRVTSEKQAKSSDTITSPEKIIDTKRTRRKNKKPVTGENLQEPTEVAKEDSDVKTASKSPIDAELEGIKRDLETSPKKRVNLKPSEGQTEMSLEQLTRELEGSSSSVNTVPTDREVVTTSRIGGDKRGEKEAHVSESIGRRSTRSRKSTSAYDLKSKNVAKSSRNSQKVVETLKSSQLEEGSTAKETNEMESKSNVEQEIAGPEPESKATSDSVISNENMAKQKPRKGRRSKKYEEKIRPELITAESEVVPSIAQLAKELDHDKAVGKSEGFFQDTAEEFRKSPRKRRSEDRPIKSNRKGISDESEISVSTRSNKNLELPASGHNYSLEQQNQNESLLESDRQDRTTEMQTSLPLKSVVVASDEKAEPSKNFEELNTEMVLNITSVEHEGTIVQPLILGSRSNERRSRRSRRLRSDPKVSEPNVIEPEKVVTKNDDCSQIVRPRGYLSKQELVPQKHRETKSDATVEEVSPVTSEGPAIAEPLMKVEATEAESESKGNRRSTHHNPEIIADVSLSDDVPQEETLPTEPKRRRGRSQRHHEIEVDNTTIVAESSQIDILNETLTAQFEPAQKHEELEKETPASNESASQNVTIRASRNDRNAKDNLMESDNENTAFPAELLMVPLEEIPLPEMPMENLTLDIPVEDIPLPPMSPVTERKKRKKLESKHEENLSIKAPNSQSFSERNDVSIAESGESPKFTKESESSLASQPCEPSSETEMSSAPSVPKADSEEPHKKSDSKSEFAKAVLPLETSPRTRRRTRAFKLKDTALDNTQTTEEPNTDQHVEIPVTTTEHEALDDIPIPAPTDRFLDESSIAQSGRRRTRAFNPKNVPTHEVNTSFLSKNIDEFEPNISDMPIARVIETSQSNQVEGPAEEPETKRERRLTRGLKASEMAGMLKSTRIEPKSDSLVEAALDDIPIPAAIETSQIKRVESPFKESDVKSDRRRTRAFKIASAEVGETSKDSKSVILAESHSTEVVLDDIPIPAPIKLSETKQAEASVKASEVKSDRRRTRSLNKSGGDFVFGTIEPRNDLKSGDMGAEIALNDIPIPAALEESEMLKSERRQTRAYKTSVVEELKRTQDNSDFLAETTTDMKESSEGLDDSVVEGFVENQLKNDKEASKSDRKRAKGCNVRESGISDVQISEQARKAEEIVSLAVLDAIPVPPVIEDSLIPQPKACNEESSSRRRTRSSKPNEMTVEEKQLSNLLKEAEFVNTENVDSVSLEDVPIPAATEMPNASHIVKGLFPSARRQTRSCTKIDQVSEKASSSTHVTLDTARTTASSGSGVGTSTGRRRTRSLKSVPVEDSVVEGRNDALPDAQIEIAAVTEESKDSRSQPTIHEAKVEDELILGESRNIADSLQSESTTKYMAEDIPVSVSSEKSPDEITKAKFVEICTPNIAGCKIGGRSNVRRSERLKSSRWDVPSEPDLQQADFQNANTLSSSENGKSVVSEATDEPSDGNLTVTGRNSSQTDSTETVTAKQLDSTEKPENEVQTREAIARTSEAENIENAEFAHISKEVEDSSSYEQRTKSTITASLTAQPIDESNVEDADKVPLDTLSKASKRGKRGGPRKQTLLTEAESEPVFENEISESIDEVSKATGLDTQTELQSLEMCRQEINKIIFGDIVSSEGAEANTTELVGSIEESISGPKSETFVVEPSRESESEDSTNELAPGGRERSRKCSRSIENAPMHEEDLGKEGKFTQLESSKESLVPPKKSKRSRFGSSSKTEEDIAESTNFEGTPVGTTEVKEESDPFKAVPAKLDEPEIILPLKKSKRVSEVSSQIAGENYSEKLGGSEFSFQDDSIMSTSLRTSIEGIINDMDIADSSGADSGKSSLLEGNSVESGYGNASKEGSVPPKKKKVDLHTVDKSEEQSDKAEGKVEAMPQAPKKKIQKLFESSQTTEKVDVPPMSPLAKKKSFLFQQDLDNVDEEAPLLSKESNDNTENGVAKKRKSSLESDCPSKKEKLDDSPIAPENTIPNRGAAIVQNSLKNEGVESSSKVCKDAKKRAEVPHVTADSEPISVDYVAPEQIIDLKPDSICQPELIPIAVTPTVMSEKDLADAQVEITSDKVINEKKPSGYVEPAAVTAETPSGPEISGTEFTSKAMMKDFDNKALTSQPNIYGLKSELLDILEGNSNSSTTSSGSEQKFKTSFDNYEKKKGTVHGIIDFEDAIPSQIVLTNKATADSVLMESPKLLERLSMAPDTKAKSKPAIDLKSIEQAPKTLVGKIAKPLGGIPKPGQKIVIRTTRAMVTTQSKTVGTKPIILSEQIIRPANTTVATAKPVAQGVKREYEDIEDVEAAFIIPKLAKPTMAKEEEPVIPVSTEKVGKGRTPKAGGKPKINQQPIIAATAETVPQPASTPPTELQKVSVQTAQDDSVFDINSMPIVLSDDLLTAEILQNMPVVLSGDVIPQAKSAAAAAVKAPIQEKLMTVVSKKGLATAIGTKQIIFKTTQPSTSTPIPAIKSTTKLKNVPSIVPTIQNKIIKGGTAFIATGTTADGKPAKYVLVPPSVTPATTQIKSTKQTVFKKQPTLQIKLPTQQAVTTTPTPTAEPAQAVGNKIMIVTNAQGQQTRVVLTPQQQKVFLQAQTGAKAKAVIKNAIPKALLESVGVNTQPGPSGVVPKTTVVSQMATAQPIAAPTGLLMPAVKNIKAPAPPKKTVQRGKPQKTILIKNQLGQTVRKIQGTDDADLDRQVAEQLEAIRASARLQQANKTPEIINYTNRAIPNSTSAANKQAAARKSYSKKAQDVNKTKVPISLEEGEKKQDSTIPALAPLSPQSRLPQVPSQLPQSLPKPAVRKVAESVSRIPDGATAKQETKSTPSASAKVEKQAESKRPESPLRQVVIQDGLGNLTTVTVGQILAIPSETVDGQPQSYMLVTVDESGNLTPLNNDALMSLDPSLGAGGDLNNVVLQVDQGQGTIAAVRTTSETTGGAEPAPQKTKIEERLKPEALKPTSHPSVPPKQTEQPRSKLEVEQQIIVKDGVTPGGGDPGGQQLIVTGDPVATQKLLESLSDGSTDLTSILANAEGGSVLVQVDGEQILIRTNPTGQPTLGVGTDTTEINEMLSAHKPNQDILAAALANTDVFQSTEQSTNQSSLVKGGASTQLSPSGLFPMQVGNVLETSLTLSSPIMTPLEVPSTNSKKIRDEADILGRVPKNVDLPITITDPNIAQTVALQPGSGLMELSLPIPETGPVGDINSPTFSFSLSGMEDSVSQKPFNGSMPLLTEDLMESQSKSSTSSSFSPNFGTLPLLDSVDSSKDGVKTSTFSDVTSLPMLSDEGVEDSGSSIGSTKLPRGSPKPIEREIIDEGLSTLGGEMCSSLSEPPPDMFDLSALAPKEEEVSSDVSSIPEQETLSTNSENSSEIPLQPPIVASLSDLKRSGDDDSEGSDEKRPRFD